MAIINSQASVAIINRMRDESSIDFKTAVPILTEGAENIREIGKIIIDNPSLKNEAYNWLVNRIGKVVLTSKLFNNPLSMFIKGELEFGSVIEEVFVNLAQPYQYSESEAEQKVFKRVSADVKASFNIVNSEVFYKTTVSDRMLRRAFLSAEGVSSLVTYIVNALYTSAQYDEFLMIKYLLAKCAVNGTVKIVPVTAIRDKASADSALTSFKEYSNNFEILSTEYNIMGVYNSSPKEKQYLITDNHNDAFIGVNSLAYMFGPAFANNDAKKVRVDNFYNFDIARLKKLLGLGDEDVVFTEQELAALEDIEAVLVDDDFFQIYYALNETGEIYNPEGLYYNTFLHQWKSFGRSPFANIVIFASGTSLVSLNTKS